MPTVHRAGAAIHYQDLGQGPALLLLHAFPLSSEAFRPQLDALASSCRILAPDHRGFGRTPLSGGEPTTMEQMARDALAVLDGAGVGKAIVGGVSMGGYAAMALLRLAPERAEGLVLIDSQLSADDDAGRAKREETAQAVESGGMTVLVDAMLPRLLGANCAAATRSLVAELILGNDPRGAAAALRGMALRPDSRETLERFQRPALVLVGEQDVITPVAKSKEVAGALPKATLRVVPGVGHLANLEAPEMVNDELRRFVASAKET